MVRTRLGALVAAAAVAMVAAVVAVASPAHAQTPPPPTLSTCKAWVQSYGHSNSTTIYGTFIVKCPHPIVGAMWIAGFIVPYNSTHATEASNVCVGDLHQQITQCTVTVRRSDPAGSQRYKFGFDPAYTKVSYVGSTLHCYPGVLYCFAIYPYL